MRSLMDTCWVALRRTWEAWQATRSLSPADRWRVSPEAVIDPTRFQNTHEQALAEGPGRQGG